MPILTSNRRNTSLECHKRASLVTLLSMVERTRPTLRSSAWTVKTCTRASLSLLNQSAGVRDKPWPPTNKYSTCTSTIDVYLSMRDSRAKTAMHTIAVSVSAPLPPTTLLIMLETTLFVHSRPSRASSRGTTSPQRTRVTGTV